MPKLDNVFLCRAENLSDIIDLKSALKDRLINSDIKYEWNNKINQFDVELKANVHFNYLKNIMQTIPYLHVMIGSLRSIGISEEEAALIQVF